MTGDRERLRRLAEGCRVDGEQSQRRAAALIDMVQMSRRLRQVNREPASTTRVVALWTTGPYPAPVDVLDDAGVVLHIDDRNTVVVAREQREATARV
jgi:hypothetical protein